MKKLSDKKNWIISFLFAGIVLAFITLFFNFTLIDSQMQILSPTFDDAIGWEMYYYNGDEKTSLTARELFETQNEVYYLSRTLSESEQQAGITTIKLNYTNPCALFLDDVLFYTNIPNLTGEIGALDFPQETFAVPFIAENITVTLPPDYVGKELTLASMNVEYSGLPMIFLSSIALDRTEVTAAVNRIIIPAAALAIAALLLIGLWFYTGISGKWNFSILLLLLAALVQTFYYLRNLGYYLPNNQLFDIPILGLGRPLFVYMPMIYLWLQMDKYRKIYAPLLLIPAFFTTLFEYLGLLGVNVWDLIYLSWQLLIPELILLIIFSVLEMRDENSVFKIFVPALSIAAVCVCGLYIGSALFSDGFYTSYINSMFAQLFTLSMPDVLINWTGTLLFLFCMLISFIELIRRSINFQTEIQALSLKNQLAYDNLRLMNQSSEELAKMRHNVLHHFNILSDLNQQGETQLVADYLKQITNDSEKILPMRICEQPIVNAIVVSALERAKKAGIDMTYQINLPAELSIKDVDLCNYLMNLLDNAIDAAAMLPINQRWIKLTMHIRANYLYIEAENSRTGEVLHDAKGNIISSKGKNHGYGMKTMLDIARRYHSDLQVDILPDRFAVQTALLLLIDQNSD